MKDLFFRFCRWALPLLGVSGAISCDNVILKPDMYGCPPVEYDEPVMYGTPTVAFSVKGKVVDADSNPIPDIEVSYEDSYNVVMTEEDGTFELQVETVGFKLKAATLKFTDVDGEANGGEFMTQSVDVPLTQTEPGDGVWDNGSYSASDVKITLTKK